MNIIKKATTSLVGMALFAQNALAAGGDFNVEDPSGINGPTKMTLGQSITGIINYFLGLLGLIAVAFLIYAGVLMVTAGGNEEQVAKAKKIITYAVIGLIIVILSFAIVQFVASVLG